MMSTIALRRWSSIHSWSSLISTLILLILFVSGLPLIFKAELETLLGYGQQSQDIKSATTTASLNEITTVGIEHNPGHVVQYIAWLDEFPNTVLLSMGKTPTSHFSENFNVLVNEQNAKLAEAQPSPLAFFMDLHTMLCAGPIGYTVMGFFALLMLVALVSGFVVYAPHMRKLEFGEIRPKRLKRARYLDVHNLTGAVTLGWAFVVGGTGMINSWGEYVLMSWRSGQLASVVAEYESVPPPNPSQFASLDDVLSAAKAAVGDKKLYYIAAPGSFMSSMHHYNVMMRGDTPQTEFMLYPVLVDAVSAEVTATPNLPTYIKALLLSQPLHFGNYGGMPLKIIWAVMDLLTIVLLLTGIFLWYNRRYNKTSAEQTKKGLQP